MSGRALKAAILDEARLPLWLSYMRQRMREGNRLGLVLGAGVSKDAGCPLWPQLVTRLTKALKVSVARIEKHRAADHTETFIAEVVSRHYATAQDRNHKGVPEKFKGYLVDASWREEIHKCLYQGIVNKTPAELQKKHSYLSALAELVCRAGFAVTFNFDDIVDEAVIACAASKEMPNPEIIFRPKVEARKGAPIIYHINGYLPREELRRASEKITLTEDAFADILLSPNSQDAEFVINQFATKTFILLGVSLSDNSLKNLLRSSANRNPANHHFVVYHEDDKAPRSAQIRKDIFDVNLHVYNLVSIFLTSKEIKAFIEILNLSDEDAFEKSLSGYIKDKIDRKYYLVGSVASGKSATLEALRSFQTHEEWVGRVPAPMYKNDKLITAEEQREIDDFLFPQLLSKNNRMHSVLPCIRIMDRAYFDLFAFSKNQKDIYRKAKELRSRFKVFGKHFEDGHVFFLKASEETLNERMARRGSAGTRGARIRFDAKRLVEQEKKLVKIYSPDEKSVFDTTDLSAGDTARRIARAILLEPYAEFSFSSRLASILRKRGAL